MTTSSTNDSATSIAKDDVVYVDGASAILGDVQFVEDNGVTVAWRATTTVEQAHDLHKALIDQHTGIRSAPIPANLVIEFHYADEGNVGAYALEPNDSLYHAARSMWSQFSPRVTSMPAYIVIRPANDTD